MRTSHALLIALFPIGTASAQPGMLDPTFGTGGKAIANVPGTYCSGQAIAQQSDGRLLVCGQTPGLTLIVRFNTDGSLDTGFGTNGLATSDPGASNDYLGSIAVQSDGRVVAAGNKFDAVAHADLIVQRYTAAGALDNTFSGDGTSELVFPGSNSYATGMVVQPDGRIVVCGERYVSSMWRSFLARFNSDGTSDAGFGTVALDMTPTSEDNLRDITLQSDGRIVVCGRTSNAGSTYMAVARYNTDGAPDASFGDAGKLLLSIDVGDVWATSVRVDAEGRIVLAGVFDDYDDYWVAAVRLMPDGALDTSFGTNGSTLVPFGAYDDTQPTLSLQFDGKVVIGVHNSAALAPDVSVIRLTADGDLDDTFGTGGIGTSNATSGSNGEYAVRSLLLADGGIAVAGFADADSPSMQLAVWKFRSGLSVGLQEVEGLDAVLAPDPVESRFTLTASDPLDNVSRIGIHDAAGRVVRIPLQVREGRLEGDASALPSGVYTLTIGTADGRGVVRFVKE